MPSKLIVCGAGALLLAAAACATTNEGAPAGTVATAKPSGKPHFLQKDILGRDSNALGALLGEPALVRREKDGEYRRYGFAVCTLIVILYPDEKGALAARRLDAVARTSADATPDLDACLAAGLLSVS